MNTQNFAQKLQERFEPVSELTKKHVAFIEAVRAKQDTMQAYFEVNQAFQALLAFDARNN